MSYKTHITTTQEDKRNELERQMDSFSTFVWRGDNSFDSFGAFIITEKLGDLKFYNGPSFSNEYSKAQFNTSSGNLLGVSFNRQQLSFKVGVYYFSIENWQDFLEWINPYEVNYLSFSHAPKYGYLVKLAKIEDTPRYVVGYDGGKPMYYTEMTLTWDLQGDSCVRANLPYEWRWSDSNSSTFTYNKFSSVIEKVGNPEKTIYNDSRLETPLLIHFPIEAIMSSESNNRIYIALDDFYGTNITTISDEEKPTTRLFECEINPWAYGSNTKTEYKFVFKEDPDLSGFSNTATEKFECPGYIITETGKKQAIKGFKINIAQIAYYYDAPSGQEGVVSIYYKDTTNEHSSGWQTGGENSPNEWFIGSDRTFYTTNFPLLTLLTKLLDGNYDEQPKDSNDKYYNHVLNTDSFYKQNFFPQYITIQYDSETGTLLYKAGDNSWKLLHLTLTDSSGEYMVQSMSVNKFKLKGDINHHHFRLKIQNGKLPDNEKPILQIYERTNVI